MPRATLLAVLGTLAALASVAQAETFEKLAAGAIRVARVEDLVWALAAPCTAGDDTQNRQCRILRDGRARTYAGATLLVEADATALTVGAWDPARKSVPVQLAGCIRCAGIAIDGRTYYAIGTGAPPRFESGTLRTPPLHDNARQFADAASAAKWRTAVAAPRVELLVRVPGSRSTWQLGDKAGVQLDILAYRVTTRCDGAVVIANPPATAVLPTATACAAP